MYGFLLLVTGCFVDWLFHVLLHGVFVPFCVCCFLNYELLNTTTRHLLR